MYQGLFEKCETILLVKITKYYFIIQYRNIFCIKRIDMTIIVLQKENNDVFTSLIDEIRKKI